METTQPLEAPVLRSELPDEAAPAAEHTCGCGSHDAAETPVLDVRVLPHAIRHAAVLGALDAVPRGRSLVLLAPHDPKRLIAEIEAREPFCFAVGYEERGPETWRLALVRIA